MSKVAIVTDSTGYIPQPLIDEYGITVLPLHLIWGEETFLDGIDIQPQEFYERLQTAKALPTSSQVTIETMRSTFEDLLEKDFDILGIFISSQLSGTINSAEQGRAALKSGQEKIAIFDSLSTSMAMGFQVLAAARAAKEGASLKECIQAAEQARENSGVFFVVDTLEFLHRGGRIGGAARLLGTLLTLKPILTITKDGKIDSVEKVRTKRKAVDRMVKLVSEAVGDEKPVRLASIQANVPDEANRLLERAGQELSAIETISSEVSPVIGTHVGPGTIGLAYMKGI